VIVDEEGRQFAVSKDVSVGVCMTIESEEPYYSVFTEARCATLLILLSPAFPASPLLSKHVKVLLAAYAFSDDPVRIVFV
jgi:hypothetical protein